jgi:hypothetical protein
MGSSGNYALLTAQHAHRTASEPLAVVGNKVEIKNFSGLVRLLGLNEATSLHGRTGVDMIRLSQRFGQRAGHRHA